MRCTVLAAAVAVGLYPTAATTAPPDPTSGIEIVRVDVVVTDSSGARVAGLRREDFELREDGRPARLSEFVAVSPASAASSASPAENGADDETSAGRCVAIVVDDLHLTPRSVDLAKRALGRFLNDVVEAGDRVALLSTSGSGEIPALTLDRAVLRQAVNQISSRESSAPGSGSQLTPGQAELVLRGESSALRLAARSLMDAPGSAFEPGGPRSTVGASSGYAPGGVDPGEKAAAEEVQRQARAILAEALRFSEVSLARTRNLLRSLSSIPGRKICLLVSDGFLVGTGTSEERSQLQRELVDAATRGGAALYALDARGLVQAGDAASLAEATALNAPGLEQRVTGLAQRELRQTLDDLTRDTGGFVIGGTSDLHLGLRRMLDEGASYYLMAFEPAGLKHDGRFHRLEVRLPRHAELVVRTRRGFLAPDERKRGEARVAARAGPTPAPAEPDPVEAWTALEAPLPARGVPMHLTVDYLSLPAGPLAIVEVSLEAGGLPWRSVDGRRRATVEIVGGVYDASGKPQGKPFGERFELDLTPAEYEDLERTGLPFRQWSPLPPGRYEVRVVAREAGAALGGAAKPVEIPDLSAGKLTLSSLFLASSGVASPGVAPDAAARATPRDAQRRRRFKRGEGLQFQLYVYNPASGPKGERDVVLQAQVRSGASVVAASKPQPVRFQQKDGTPLPETHGLTLDGMAPGSYELRVVVVDRRASATASRSIDFTVE